MLSEHNKATLKKLLESVPPKVRLEILMQIRMAEGQAKSGLTLSKELQELVDKNRENQ